MLALGLFGASLGSACGYQATELEAATTSAPLLDATEATPEGTPYDLSSLDGRPAVVFLWAPWCGPCRRMAPTVAGLPDAHPDVAFLSVSGRSHVREVTRFIDEQGLNTVDQVYDNDLTIASAYALIQQPGWLFVTADGRVATASGELSAERLTELIDEARNP